MINEDPVIRRTLEGIYGQVWNADELARDFEVGDHMKPLVIVVRKSDGKRGTMVYRDKPRYYFNFQSF